MHRRLIDINFIRIRRTCDAPSGHWERTAGFVRPLDHHGDLRMAAAVASYADHTLLRPKARLPIRPRGSASVRSRGVAVERQAQHLQEAYRLRIELETGWHCPLHFTICIWRPNLRGTSNQYEKKKKNHCVNGKHWEKVSS